MPGGESSLRPSCLENEGPTAETVSTAFAARCVPFHSSWRNIAISPAIRLLVKSPVGVEKEPKQ